MKRFTLTLLFAAALPQITFCTDEDKKELRKEEQRWNERNDAGRRQIFEAQAKMVQIMNAAGTKRMNADDPRLQEARREESEGMRLLRQSVDVLERIRQEITDLENA